jgi:two-component system sensor histidine kinase DegS
MTDGRAPLPDDLPALAARAAADVETLDRELTEIDMLVEQARTEAVRHEARRAQAAEKLSAATARSDMTEAVKLSESLVTLTKRTAVMEAQVDILAGKQRTLQRYREAMIAYADALGSLARGLGPGEPGSSGGVAAGGAGSQAQVDARVLLDAQEGLRREIARAMHDGPAQSLTNIVLQAQIVDRLVGQDDDMAKGELRLLMEMVQQTLEATKTFIFDVRPMVLDDLGLVPTVRRACRERSKRSQVAVVFDSTGQDQRLSSELESGLFRIVDEALNGYLGRRPERVEVAMTWDSELVLEVAAIQQAPVEAEAPTPAPAEDLPPALAAMIEDRRTEALPDPGALALPHETWHDAEGRARSLGLVAELLDDGRRLRIAVPLAVPA